MNPTHDDTLSTGPGRATEHAGGRMSTHQLSPRTDPSMRHGDSGRGTPYESDADGGDAMATDGTVASAVPLDDEDPADAHADREAEADREAVAATAHDDDDDDDDAEFELADSPPPPALREAHDDFRSDRGFAPGGEDEGAARVVTKLREFPEAKAPREEDRYGRPVDRDQPMPGYTHLTVPEILDKIDGMSLDEVRAVQRYEGSHRRRKTLLVKLERLTRAMASGAMPVANTRRGETAGSH